MGNCQAIFHSKQRGATHAVKPDGRVLKFRAPISVRALLSSFRNSRVGVCRGSSRHISEESRLQTGKVCYTVPAREGNAEAAGRTCSVSATMEETERRDVNRRRVKLVITKKKLRELLSNRVLTEQVLAAIGSRGGGPVTDAAASARSWKPELETIPE